MLEGLGDKRGLSLRVKGPLSTLSIVCLILS